MLNSREYPNPARVGSAVIASECDSPDPQQRLYVRDYARAGRTPIEVGVIDSPESHLYSAGLRWSGDKSLLLSYRASTAPHASPDDVVFYTGYDFRTHHAIKSQGAPALVRQRGGVGRSLG